MHGGGGGGSGSKKKATINVIPLIDVIMFLLATFVLFTLSMNKANGPAVDLSEAKTGTDVDPNKAITVTLDTEGKMSWNNEAVTWDNFIIELIKYSEQESPTILINFDQNANYGQAMSILNEIRKAPKPVKVYLSTKLPKP
ncbi:MAG TPA: biopolymer transporter ExbD [Opitutaceae bacterium]|nr:biopolymer transporter ExbD [Opitutaceae bacterium]